jgi:hypothetical protein
MGRSFWVKPKDEGKIPLKSVEVVNAITGGPTRTTGLAATGTGD